MFNVPLERKVQNSTKKQVCNRIYLSNGLTVVDLEDFVESKLAETLHRVAKERRSPALAEFSDTGLRQRDTESFDDTAILGWIDLDATFHQI